jgi:diguanylate cyclase (GGDEF)-like protein
MLLHDRIAQALARACRDGPAVALLFLDLDHFKLVNDTRGHGTGDRLLSVVAGRILRAVRPDDTVARFGGDEFVVVCHGVSDEEQVRTIAGRVENAITVPIRLDDEEIVITASIGLVLGYPGATVEGLIRDADTAMYQAKAAGRGRAETFDANLRTRAEHRVSTERALRVALQDDQLRVKYQPIVSMRDGAIVGVEALVRWQHPEFGLTEPADFIALAEETGLIIPIGTWVLARACRDLAQWRQQYREAAQLSVSVNLSPRQLRDPYLLVAIKEATSAADLDPSAITLEITENALTDDLALANVTLSEIAALGVRLSIDDFGTGYSSLAYLKRFPVHEMKIDRTFVEDVTHDQYDEAIVSAVTYIARALELDVVAEGVETLEQDERLSALGCQRAQGFYYSLPVDADDFAHLLGAPAVPRAG